MIHISQFLNSRKWMSYVKVLHFFWKVQAYLLLCQMYLTHLTILRTRYLQARWVMNIRLWVVQSRNPHKQENEVVGRLMATCFHWYDFDVWFKTVYSMKFFIFYFFVFVVFVLEYLILLNLNDACLCLPRRILLLCVVLTCVFLCLRCIGVTCHLSCHLLCMWVCLHTFMCGLPNLESSLR